MPYPLPPWLEGNPSQFVPEQYGRGVQLGIAERGEAAQEQAEQQRLAIAQQTAQREQQQLQVQNAINQQKLQMSMDAAKRKYQAQQTYQQMVASGADPTEAMLKIGPLLGENGTTMAAAVRNQQMAKVAQLPPEFKTDPNTGGTIFRWGSHIGTIPAPKTATASTGELQKLKLQQTGIQHQLSSLDKKMQSERYFMTPKEEQAKDRQRYDELTKRLDALAVDDSSESTDPGEPSNSQTASPPSDSTGKSGIKVLSIQQVN